MSSADMDSNNIFSALSKKKKKSSRHLKNGSAGTDLASPGRSDGGSNGGEGTTVVGALENGGDASGNADPEKDLWNTPSLTVSSWADCDDDDMSALGPLPSWAEASEAKEKEKKESKEEKKERKEKASEARKKAKKEKAKKAKKENREEAVLPPELDMLIPDDENEVDGDNAGEDGNADSGKTEEAIAAAAAPAGYQSEKQLSKKELKKKEMEELDSVLGELGISVGDSKEGDGCRSGAPTTAPTDDVVQPGESKTAARKRRKAEREAALAAQKEEVEKPGDETEDQGETAPDLLDPAEAKRRLAAAKKKKASSSASVVAKAKAEAKLRASKNTKKDKSNYNQFGG